jgi:WXG100 family type VII secretion target
MASSEIACSISALGSDISNIQSQYDAVVKAKEALMTAVNSMNGMWAGSAHDTFVSAFNNDYERIGNLCKTIDNIIKCLENAKKEYAKCEQTVRSYVDAITV